MHFKVNLVLFCCRCTLRNIEKSMLVLTFCTRMWQSENELMSARAANLYRNPNGGKEFLMQFRICAWFTRICFVHAQTDCGHANEIDTTISVFFCSVSMCLLAVPFSNPADNRSPHETKHHFRLIILSTTTQHTAHTHILCTDLIGCGINTIYCVYLILLIVLFSVHIAHHN